MLWINETGLKFVSALVIFITLSLSQAVAAMPTLVSGNGFSDERMTLPAVGNSSEPGYQAKAIANWDVVPFQVVKKPFEIGVVAFHMSGIERVDFSLQGGDEITVKKATLNPRTKVTEYTVLLDPKSVSDGLIEVRATAYPNTGLPRQLDPLILYANAGSSLKQQVVHVGIEGDDSSGEGTVEKPYGSIAFSIKQAGPGGTVVLLDEGSYDLKGSAGVRNEDWWLTIRAADGLDRNKVILKRYEQKLVRLRTDKLKFQGLSIDTGSFQYIYPENGEYLWFDDVRWFSSSGWRNDSGRRAFIPVRPTVYIGDYFVTNSLAENLVYGFVDAALVRNSHIEQVSGDALQRSRFVVNVTIDTMDGRILPIHSDIIQYFGHFENVIIYGVTARNIKSVQNLFFGHRDSSFKDMAFVNIAVENLIANPPASQLFSNHDHILFFHVATPRQRWLIRDDVTGDAEFKPRNVVMANNVFQQVSSGDFYKKGVPEGISLMNNHFVEGEAHGTHASRGNIELDLEDIFDFKYTGPSVADIQGTGAVIPGLSVPAWRYGTSEKPNKGAFPLVSSGK